MMDSGVTTGQAEGGEEDICPPGTEKVVNGGAGGYCRGLSIGHHLCVILVNEELVTKDWPPATFW